jgi:ABC-2 type transport system permease protein
MNTVVLPAPRVSLLRCYGLEAKHEFLRLLRAPSFAVPTLVFPPMFYLLFAVLFGGRSGGFQANIYLLATYGVFGVMSPGLFGFGVSVAMDRERGWLTYKRALPMPPGAYLAAKLAMAMLACVCRWAHGRRCMWWTCWVCCRSARSGSSSAAW